MKISDPFVHQPASGRLINAELFAYFAEKKSRRKSSSFTPGIDSHSPEKVPDPYTQLGTHPDLMYRLWDELGGLLPVPCQWVVFGNPVLVHPETGIIFGLASGTVYALRLPQAQLKEAFKAGAKQTESFPAYPEFGIAASTWDLRRLGCGWIFGGWYAAEPDWCRSAFEAAKVGDAEWLPPERG
jgi:hypothetical protein